MGTTGQSITLANSIIGVGILAMPFCFQQCGVLLASLILLFMGLVSRLCCYFLLKSAILARRRNFEFLAFHVFGSAGKMAVEVGIIGFLMGTCIAYFVVVGDLGPQIIAKMFNINQSDILRTSIMVIVSLVCVLPLGLLRNVDSLSNVSAATIGFYFCLVMKVIAEAASQLLTGDWHRRMEMWKPSGMLQCVPIFSMALFCQTQLFEIFESHPSLSLEKMNVVTKNAINICSAVYFTLGLFGYIAFCSHDISGNILMSLSPTMASDVIKLGFVMSLAFSFPLIIFPCRASLYSFLYKKVHSSHHDHIINHSIPETTFRCITVAIIAVALFISLLIPNIELVLGLVGSTIGVLICVVFPAACFVNVTFKNTNERVLAKGIVVLGLIIMVLGTYANLEAAESKLDRYDDKYITQERIDKIVEDFFEKRERADELFMKPVAKENSVPVDAHKIVDEGLKDSEVQPPNPVPPESQSNEKHKLDNIEAKKDIKSDDLLKEVLLPEAVKEAEAVDKVSETHPKNVITKLNSKLGNGDSTKEIKVEAPKEDKVPSNDDKIDMMKQQKLIETIKQHGEEQKELIKEQKEILDEIKKTKKELQQNKNDIGSNEAKKIAVESIKQIANMAIQSIGGGGGVSEKPIDQEKNKKSDQLEKLTNEAMQEIAKKAVETIEAIQEIKENPKAETKLENKNIIPNSNVPNGKSNEPIPYAQNNVIANPPPIPIQNQQQNDQKPQSGNNDEKSPANGNAAQVKSPNSEAVLNDKSLIKPELSPINNIPKNIQNSQGTENKVNAPVQSNPVHNEVPTKQGIVIPKEQIQPSEIKKTHSHSPDEPQSYKQGEDLQMQNSAPINNKVNNNVPLPLAINRQSKQVKDEKLEVARPDSNIAANKVEKSEVNGNIIQGISNNENNGAKNSYQNNQQSIDIKPSVVRNKREVVDCTKTVQLEPGDKKICEALVSPHFKENSEILPKVDLKDIELLGNMDANILYHIGRSLKSLNSEDAHKKR